MSDTKKSLRVQEFQDGEWKSRSFGPKATRRPPLTWAVRHQIERELIVLGNLMRDAGASE